MQEAILLNFKRELSEEEKKALWAAMKAAGLDKALEGAQSQTYSPEFQFPVLYFP